MINQNDEWLGLAEDISEFGVIGKPYPGAHSAGAATPQGGFAALPAAGFPRAPTKRPAQRSLKSYLSCLFLLVLTVIILCELFGPGFSGRLHQAITDAEATSLSRNDPHPSPRTSLKITPQHGRHSDPGSPVLGSTERLQQLKQGVPDDLLMA